MRLLLCLLSISLKLDVAVELYPLAFCHCPHCFAPALSICLLAPNDFFFPSDWRLSRRYRVKKGNNLFLFFFSFFLRLFCLRPPFFSCTVLIFVSFFACFPLSQDGFYVDAGHLRGDPRTTFYAFFGIRCPGQQRRWSRRPTHRLLDNSSVAPTSSRRLVVESHL